MESNENIKKDLERTTVQIYDKRTLVESFDNATIIDWTSGGSVEVKYIKDGRYFSIIIPPLYIVKEIPLNSSTKSAEPAEHPAIANVIENFSLQEDFDLLKKWVDIQVNAGGSLEIYYKHKVFINRISKIDKNHNLPYHSPHILEDYGSLIDLVISECSKHASKEEINRISRWFNIFDEYIRRSKSLHNTYNR